MRRDGADDKTMRIPFMLELAGTAEIALKTDVGPISEHIPNRSFVHHLTVAIGYSSSKPGKSSCSPKAGNIVGALSLSNASQSPRALAK